MTEIPAKETTTAVRKVTPVYVIDPATLLPTGSFGGGGGSSGGTATAASPTYTEGATAQPLSVNLHGGLRVVAVNPDGTDVDPTVPALVEGGTAHDAAMSTRKPVAIGGLAKTALPTAVSDGDISHVMLDRMGRVISRAVLEESLADVTVDITATGALLAADASNKNRIYGLILANTGANALKVQLKDDTTLRATWQVPAGETRGFMVPSDAGLAQAAINKAWNLTLTGTSPALSATALYVKAGA